MGHRISKFKEQTPSATDSKILSTISDASKTNVIISTEFNLINDKLLHENILKKLNDNTTSQCNNNSINITSALPHKLKTSKKFQINKNQLVKQSKRKTNNVLKLKTIQKTYQKRIQENLLKECAKINNLTLNDKTIIDEFDNLINNTNIDQRNNKTSGSIVIKIRMLKMENSNTNSTNIDNNNFFRQTSHENELFCINSVQSNHSELNVQNNSKNDNASSINSDFNICNGKHHVADDPKNQLKYDQNLNQSFKQCCNLNDQNDLNLNELELNENNKLDDLLSKNNSICDKMSKIDNNNQNDDESINNDTKSMNLSSKSTSFTELSSNMNNNDANRCNQIASKLMDTVSPYPHHTPMGKVLHECECK